MSSHKQDTNLEVDEVKDGWSLQTSTRAYQWFVGTHERARSPGYCSWGEKCGLSRIELRTYLRPLIYTCCGRLLVLIGFHESERDGVFVASCHLVTFVKGRDSEKKKVKITP